MIGGDDKNVRPVSVQSRNIKDVLNGGEHHLRTRFIITSTPPVDSSNNIIKQLYTSSLWKPKTDNNSQRSLGETVRTGDSQRRYSIVLSASAVNALDKLPPMRIANNRSQSVVATKPTTLLEEVLTKRYGSFYQELVAYHRNTTDQREKVDWFSVLSRTSGAGESRFSMTSVQPVSATPKTSSLSNESVYSNYPNTCARPKTPKRSVGGTSNVGGNFGTNPSRNRRKNRIAKVSQRNRARRRTRTIGSRYSSREIYSFDSKLNCTENLIRPPPPTYPKLIKARQESEVRKKRPHSSSRSRSSSSISSLKRKGRKPPIT